MIPIWIFSKDGYLSIVEYQPHFILPKTRKEAYKKLNSEEKKLGKGYKPATAKLLGSHQLVRARVEADLDKLMDLAEQRDSVALRFTDKSADYHYRAIVNRVVVGEYIANLIATLDYSSHVKEVIRDNAPPSEGSHSRYSGMFDIWDATSRWQASAPYSGGRWDRPEGKGSFPPPTGYISWTEYFEKEDAKRPKGKSLLDSWADKKSKLPGEDEPKLPLGSFDDDDLITAPTVGDLHLDDDWLEDNPMADPRDLEFIERQNFWLTHERDTDNTRLENENLATLVVDDLVENFGNVPIEDLPEDEVARAFRRVLTDRSLRDESVTDEVESDV